MNQTNQIDKITQLIPAGFDDGWAQCSGNDIIVFLRICAFGLTASGKIITLVMDEDTGSLIPADGIVTYAAEQPEAIISDRLKEKWNRGFKEGKEK